MSAPVRYSDMTDAEKLRAAANALRDEPGPLVAEPLAAALDYAADVDDYARERGYQTAGWVPRMVAVSIALLGEEIRPLGELEIPDDVSRLAGGLAAVLIDHGKGGRVVADAVLANMCPRVMASELRRLARHVERSDSGPDLRCAGTAMSELEIHKAAEEKAYWSTMVPQGDVSIILEVAAPIIVAAELRRLAALYDPVARVAPRVVR